jgi:hypothetical protein
MIQWDGILDDSDRIEPIWFSRPKRIVIDSSTSSSSTSTTAQTTTTTSKPPPPQSSFSSTATETNTATTGAQDTTTSTNDTTTTSAASATTTTTTTNTSLSKSSSKSSLIITPNNDKNQSTWKPLRKCDCTLLNQKYQFYLQQQQQQQQEKTTTTTAKKNNDEDDEDNNNNNNNNTTNIVYIDSGRKTINFKDMTLHPTYQYPYSNTGRNSSSSSGSTGSNNNNSSTTNHDATTTTTGTISRSDDATTSNTIDTTTTTTTTSIMNNVEEICCATWFLRYDITSSNKDVTATTTSSKPSATSTNTNNNKHNNSNQPQQRIEFKDGTTVYSSPYILYPISNTSHVKTMEQLYQDLQQTVSSSSNDYDNDIQSILQKEVIVDEAETYKVQVYNKSNSNIISLKLVPNETHWFNTIVQFKPSYILQRGYNDYIVPNEDIDNTLGSIQHIIFVIHGIGEALFHRTDIQITGLIEQTNILRTQIQNKQSVQYQKQCQSIRNNKNNNKKKNSSNDDTTSSLPLPPPPKRIEFIPIEWFSCLHGNSNSTNNHDLMNQLQLITLKTIPALRTIANDVLLDVLLYCTPMFCTLVLQTVLQQIIYYHTIITKHVHPNFIQNGGTFSIIGHSLGTVITWDLLSLLKQHQMTTTTSTTAIPKTISDNDNNDSDQQQQQLLSSMSSLITTTSSYGPSLIRPLDDVLPFTPQYTFLLGSPIGLFLTLRNARNIFLNEYNDLQLPITTNTSIDSNNINNILRVSSFTLPTKYLYNIFHPSDPVAYRIEPLLINLQEAIVSNIQSKSNNNNIIIDQKQQELLQRYIPEPVYLTVPGEDVRLHIKALQFTNVVRKSLFQNNNIITSSSLHNNSNHSGSSKTKGNNDTKTNNETKATTAQKINSWTTLLESAVAAVGNSSLTATPSTTYDDKMPSSSSLSTSQKSSSNDKNIDTSSSTSTNSNTLHIPLGGIKQQRVDYALQPLLVDNEYIR